MNVVLDLAPEIAATMQAQAAARGLRLEEYLCKLAEQATAGSVRHRVSQEEFERDLDAFSEGTEGLPALSDADLSRAAMYADHD